MSEALAPVANPFGNALQKQQSALAAGEESKAVAEIQSMLVIAKKFPRDPIKAADAILRECSRKTLAEVALYSYARGGSDISGPSIRLAEAIARGWGNVEFGFREVLRGVGSDGVTYSEVVAYAWDLESNTRRPVSFRVRHWRDTKKGGYPIKDERDIYELTANQAQRRVRSCILGVIPGDVVDAAKDQCAQTLKANADTSPEGIKKMLEKFAEIGVSKEMIEGRIQRRIKSILPAQVINLRNVYNSISDGMSTPADWFEEGETPAKAAPKKELESLPDEHLMKISGKWQEQIDAGNKTPADMIAFLSAKYTISNDQRAQINSMARKPEPEKSETPNDADDFYAQMDAAQEAN